MLTEAISGFWCKLSAADFWLGVRELEATVDGVEGDHSHDNSQGSHSIILTIDGIKVKSDC